MLHIAGKMSAIFLKVCLLMKAWFRSDFPFCLLIGYCFQNRTKIWALLKQLRYRFALRNSAEILFTLKHFRPIEKSSPISFKCVLTFKSVAKLKTIFCDGLVKLLPALITTWLQCQRDVSYMRCPYMQDFLTIKLSFINT